MKKFKILLFIVGIITVLSLHLLLKINNKITKIVVKYSADSEFINLIDPKENLIEKEIIGNDFIRIKQLLKKVKKTEWDYDYFTEAILEINDDYTIMITNELIGYKSYFNSSVGELVSIPRELYTLIKEIINKDNIPSNYEFTLDNNNKYIITTDMKWITMQNDGGSNTSIYYQIDLDNNIITKVKKIYKANLNGTPETRINNVYTKNIPDNKALEIKQIIEDILNKDDDNSDNNYNNYTIETFNLKKDIYNLDSINTLKKELEDIDKL